MTALEWAMLVSLSVLWGGSFFFTGVAVRELPPFAVVVSAILLGVFVLGEAFLLKHAFGMAMIGVGLTAIDGRPWRLAKELLAPRAQIDQPNADGGGI